MTFTLNGRVRELEAGETVASLLERLGLGGRFALVERNGEPVDRAVYAATKLEGGDTVVVARPVAGG